MRRLYALKNLQRESAIDLSFAMAIQFGMADTCYANTVTEELIIEEHTQEDPVTVEETMPAVHATKDIVQVSEPKSVTLNCVAEDGTILLLISMRRITDWILIVIP